MKRFSRNIFGALFFIGLIGAASAQTERKSWKEVEGPKLVSVLPRDDDKKTLVVSFTIDISTDGADKAVVDMTDATGKVIDSRTLGRSKKDIKTAEFAPASSGTWYFTITASRKDETEVKATSPASFAFVYPLASPLAQARNLGNGKLLVTWAPVLEAENYLVTVKSDKDGTVAAEQTLPGTSAEIGNLAVGTLYGITVQAVRGSEKVSSPVYKKTVKAAAEREWKFTWFGQSSNGALNTIETLDSDNMKFRLNSCTFDPKTQAIILKGGKFTTFHDGISYYYTEIDPKTENFSLTAKFTVDYINTTADGQEGFGLVAMDSLGENGVNMKNHYTNSASIIATKFEATIGGVKKTGKDTIGARFVSGITNEVLALGDSGIAQNGVNVSNAFSYDPSDIVKAGDSYTLTLKKTNTGYHAIISKPNAAEDAVTEYIMYGPEKLLMLDRNKVYVGFAVARGCNVTVSDVSMVITDPKTDPPAQEEPPELVPLAAIVDSPTTYTSTNYPFVFNANADGLLTVTDRDGKIILKDKPVTHGVDCTAPFTLVRGFNDYNVSFKPDPNYRPGKKQAIGRFDRELNKYVESYASINIMHSVVCLSYDLAELHVSPNGSALAKGTAADPLDLVSAINYAKPGQPVILAPGVYYPTRGLTIERGNSGTEKQRKTLTSEAGGRAIIDFSSSTLGFVLSGDYWTISDIDIRRTQGNVKGLQVAGNYNVVSGVNAYQCGDTGIQISGAGSETFEKWPSNNLVVNCTSHDNCDPAANNADGFAAKLTCANGNVFRGCIAYSNIDDGWDLFSKIESGPIGPVLVENCVAYKNGSLSDGSGNGDGNGFKLGGDGIAVAHTLRNSVSFANGASGITSNSNPALHIERCTSFANKGPNVNLYGKGAGSRLFVVSGVLSLSGGSGDVYREMPELASPANYFFNGAKCLNSEGAELKTDAFANADLSTVPGRKADGSIDLKGFLVPKANALPAGVGANIQ